MYSFALGSLSQFAVNEFSDVPVASKALGAVSYTHLTLPTLMMFDAFVVFPSTEAAT